MFYIAGRWGKLFPPHQASFTDCDQPLHDHESFNIDNLLRLRSLNA
jgi:hypothetical protein